MTPFTVPTLPENDLDLARVLRLHANREEAKMSARMTRWLLASSYYKGERRYYVYDTRGVRLQTLPDELDKDGSLPMRIEMLISNHNKLVGMFNGLDLRPQVIREDTTLTAVRDRSVSQVVLDAVVASQAQDAAKLLAGDYLSRFGSCGLHSHVADFPAFGLTGDLEVVHPREICPFPSVDSNLAKVAGIMRQRWVPWAQIKDIKEFRKVSPDQLNVLELDERQIGDQEPDRSLSSAESGGMLAAEHRGYRIDNRPNAKLTETWVKVRELWMGGPRDTCSNYVVSSGSHIFFKEKYEDSLVYCPLSFERFYENGTFHGAGLFDLLFSLVREFEKMVRRLVQNVKDSDQYPILILPAGVISEMKAMKNDGTNLKYLTVDPEPKGTLGMQGSGVNAVRPVHIPVNNTGNLPGDTAVFLKELIKDLVPLRDIAEDKGRVDSFSGLQFLQEEGQRAVTTPVAAMVRLFSKAYRYTAGRSFQILRETPRPIPVGRMSIDLAGAVVDLETATLSFEGNRNRVPDISRLTFSTRQTMLRSLAARKAEAVQLLQMKTPTGEPVVDVTDFYLYLIKEGLDFALYLDQKQGAYDSGVYQILKLYNDGVTPGQIVDTPYMASPEIQRRLVKAFMESPKMRVASVAVINAFRGYLRTLQNYSGNVMVTPMPDVYDTAIRMGAQGLMGGPPASAPPQAPTG